MSLDEWLATNYDRENYTTDLVAVYEPIKGKQRSNFDYYYKVVDVRDDFCAARSATHFVIPLGVPISLHNTRALWLKKHDDELFCNAAMDGRKSEPSLNLCAHADFSRAGDFLHYATQDGASFDMNVSVALYVIETMQFYCANFPEYNKLCQDIFHMPQVSDSMQKYIACIVLGVDYSLDELDVIVRTSIGRNKDDLAFTTGLLVLLPMVKQLFAETKSSALRQRLVARTHSEFTSKLASIDLTVKRTDSWWYDVVCTLATSFGLTSPWVSKLRLELGPKPGKVGSKRPDPKIVLPNNHMSWLRGRSTDMRVVQLATGARLVGQNSHSKCQFNLVPSLKATAIQSYCVDLTFGNISVSSDPESQGRTLLASSPITVNFDTRQNICVVTQNDSKFTLASQRLTIRFSGGLLTITKMYPGTLSASNADICAICLTEVDDDDHSTDCEHRHHAHCINTWIGHCLETDVEPTCPVCRALI